MDRERLRELLSSGRYGHNAEEVLNTCGEILEVELEWTREEVTEFQKDVGINPQVWRKLLTIGRDQRLHRYLEDLPDSYTALYVLTSISDEAIEFGFGFGELSKQTSSREITRWKNQWRLESSTNHYLHPIHLVSEKRLPREMVNSILEKLNRIAIKYEVLLQSAPTESLLYQQKQEKLLEAEVAKVELETEIEHFLYLSSEELRKHFSVEEFDQLVEGDFRTFAQALLNVSSSRINMMSRYGSAYCHKIALEQIRSDSRTQRFNYKRRLVHVASKYPHLRPVIESIQSRFFSQS